MKSDPPKVKNAKRNTRGRKQAECKHCLLSIGNNNPESKIKSQKYETKSHGELVHVSSQISELV